MHDEADFLSAIRQTPADDVARLVFADWLDEQDDPACQPKAAFIRLELRMAEAPEQGLNRVRWTNKLQKLAAQLDPAWLAVVSHPKLEACRMSFRFECPKQWAYLNPTDDAKVRFCDTCKENVHYCDTLQEAQSHAANDHCVALALPLLRHSVLNRVPQPPPPKFLAPPRLTPKMIERLRNASVRGIGVGTPPTANEMPPVPIAEPERQERQPGERPHWKQQRKKARRKNRNIQRDDWENAE